MPDDIVIYDGYGDGVVDGIAYDVPAALPGPVGSGSEWEHFDACQAAQVRRSGRAVEDGADYNRFEGVVGTMYGGALLFGGAFGVALVVVLVSLLFGGV